MTVGVSRRFPLLVVVGGLVLGLTLFGGCTNGTELTASQNFDCGTPGSRVLCLQSCNLGCSSSACSRTDIAQNEIIILTFSDNIDPNSVNSSSIRFRTPTGDEPVGEYLVNGNRVEFVPTLSISGGQTFFGFTTGETYTMTIVAGPDQPEVVRSVSGRVFAKPLTCTLQSSRGIVDLNQSPPSARLIVPTANQLDAAPLDTEIQLEFNELIDFTPFLSGSQGPVEFRVRRNREFPAGSGLFECDPNSTPQPITGQQQLTFDAAAGVSVLGFRPSQPLPGNVCVEVLVTQGVTDLSGRPAEPQVFTFRTVVVPLTSDSVVEEFEDNTNLDEEASAAAWEGGSVRFFRVGGDGRHGDFGLGLCTLTSENVEGRTVYEFDCTDTTIPAANTTTGASLTVQNGRFYFGSFVVPSNVHLRLVGDGTAPAVITVAGRLDVQGVIEANGGSLTTLPNPSLSADGQIGAPGGLWGGKGGNGGRKSNSTKSSTGQPTAPLPPLSQYWGQDGEDVRVRSGHAYAASVDTTGGRGSEVFPASANAGDQLFGVNPPPTSVLYYATSSTAGGGGGGLFAAGVDGVVEAINHPNPQQFMGPIGAGGTALPLFPWPALGGTLTASSDHFLVGGAGGGGAGSNSTLSLSLSRSFAPGAGGAGGGGAFALRAGNLLRVAPQGRLLAAGGSAANNGPATGSGPQVAPGGGGSGGSIVLQAGNMADIAGLVDVRGGLGGFFSRRSTSSSAPLGADVQIRGGNGSPGFVRFEMETQPEASQLPNMVPTPTAANLGELTEVDTLVSCRSKWYSTGLIFGPAYRRYEIYATVGGVPVLYSDDPQVPDPNGIYVGEAAPGAAVRALWQAGDVDPTTLLPNTQNAWRTRVASGLDPSLAADGLNGFRFLLFFDRAFASSVTIERVVVVYEH